MLKNFFSALIIILLCSTFNAQQLFPLNETGYIKNIEENIKKASNEEGQLYNKLLLSEYWAPLDKNKGKSFLDAVLQSPHRSALGKGVLEYYQAVFYAHHSSKEKAVQLYEIAIQSFKKSDRYKDLMLKALYNNAYIQVESKGYDFMVKALTDKYIPLAKDLNNIKALAYGYTQLGLVFMSVGQFDTAEDYHLQALEQLKKIQIEDTEHLITYLNLVSNYCYKPDSKSAKVYLDKAAVLIKKYPNSQHYSNFYYQEAMYYTTIQDYEKALVSLEKGVQMAKEKMQGKLLHMLYFRKYNVFLMKKDYLAAKRQLEQILSENILSKEAVNRRVTYTQLAAVNDVLGNHKDAYEWMKKSSALGDSLQQSKLLEKMNEMEVLHQSSEKQQKIDNLELEKKENEIINRTKNQRIALLGIALIFSLIIVFLVYHNYIKQKQLNKQIGINHQQELDHLHNKKKYEATRALLKGEEQERQRIAQDLHDSIGGMLASIRMSISKEKYEEHLLQKLDKTIVEMRRISRNLMPETLKNLGLEIALKELCEAMSQKQLHIQFEAFNVSKDIPFKTQLALYRIAQESISNIIKYAQANSVIVQISQNLETINLTIEDDGVGFDKTEIVYGLGLNNIENRVRLINGTVDIVSQKGEGTTINVECHVW